MEWDVLCERTGVATERVLYCANEPLIQWRLLMPRASGSPLMLLLAAVVMKRGSASRSSQLAAVQPRWVRKTKG